MGDNLAAKLNELVVSQRSLGLVDRLVQHLSVSHRVLATARDGQDVVEGT
jgi:hypothetical protein